MDPDGTDALRRALADPANVRLDGVHALKHALRFGAEVERVVSPDPGALHRLLAELAPDVALPVAVEGVTAGTWRALVGPRGLPSPALALARRPAGTLDEALAAPGRLVVVEAPRHLGNLGAVVRVAAAAGAAGVLVVGDADPWHPTALRAAAGLHFALTVLTLDALPERLGGRTVVGLDPAGESLAAALPTDAVVVLGTERGGLSPAMRARVDRTVAVPMRAGVSSLNLATAAAAVLLAR
jgi:TrmH family RNA methyltransferase